MREPYILPLTFAALLVSATPASAQCEGAPDQRACMCVYNYTLEMGRRGDPRTLRLVAETRRRGETRSLVGTRDFVAMHRQARRACGLKP
jgi:hypothetical protein